MNPVPTSPLASDLTNAPSGPDSLMWAIPHISSVGRCQKVVGGGGVGGGGGGHTDT